MTKQKQYRTTIAIDMQTWTRIYKLKTEPSDSHLTVIQEALTLLEAKRNK